MPQSAAQQYTHLDERTRAARHQRFIVTTVNKRVLEQRVGKTDAIELVGGHADDFDPLLDVLAATVKR